VNITSVSSGISSYYTRSYVMYNMRFVDCDTEDEYSIVITSEEDGNNEDVSDWKTLLTVDIREIDGNDGETLSEVFDAIIAYLGHHEDFDTCQEIELLYHGEDFQRNCA
jgi:hypothetical protein